MDNTVEEMVSRIKNSEVLEFCDKPSENRGVAIKFYHADRFYDDYEDKKLGAKVKSLAKDYYDVWKEDRSTRVRYWNYSQFGYKDL